MNMEAASSSKAIITTGQLRTLNHFDFDFLFPITYTHLITVPVEPSLGSFDTLNPSGWGDFVCL
jgi:hypothetical protein